jgi:hypothetical protein
LYEQQWVPSHLEAPATACVLELKSCADDSFILGFNNAKRSLKLAERVWERNDSGKVAVDWLDIIEEFAWELYLV